VTAPTTAKELEILFDQHEKFNQMDVKDALKFRPSTKKQKKAGFHWLSRLLKGRGGEESPSRASVSLDNSLLYVIEGLSLRGGIHRLPVLDYSGENQVVVKSIISQSDVIRFIYEHLNALSPAKRLLTVADLMSKNSLLAKNLVCVKTNKTALQAFQKMLKKNVDGLAVVDKEGNLQESLTLRDIKGISSTAIFFSRLYLPVLEYISFLPRITPKKANETGERVVTVTTHHTLEKVIKKLHKYHIHRVLIAEDSKPIGVVTLSSVLKEILSTP